MALGMPMAMGSAVAQAAGGAASPILDTLAGASMAGPPAGMFGAGGILEKLAAATGGGGMGGLGALAGAGGLGSLLPRVAVSSGNRSFAFGPMRNNQGMDTQQVFDLAERLMRKLNNQNEAVVTETAGKEPVRSSDFAVKAPRVGMGYPMAPGGFPVPVGPSY